MTQQRTTENYFDSGTYTVIDNLTNEVLDVDIFIERASSNGWQKAYTKTLADYIGCCGNASAKVLAYLVKEKDSKNIIIATKEKIAKQSGASIGTVKIVITELRKKNLIKSPSAGVYILSPNILRNGSTKIGSMVLRLWSDAK